MRIRILKPTGGYRPGEVVDLPPDVCADWLRAGMAEPEEREEPETATTLKGAPKKQEKAVSRGRVPKRMRKR